jgi:putative DNA primase/helicase
MNDPIDQFRQAIESAGLTPPDAIIDDGAIHRFSTNGRRGDDSGWYMLHTDGIAAGAFGCWRAGLQSTWCAKSDNAMTTAERDTHRQRIKAMQVQRETEQVERHHSAATDAAQRWQVATTCAQHDYLITKGVQGYGVRMDGAGALIVPMRDTAGTLYSLQTITPDGDKRFLSGGKVKGCYHSIGKPAGVLVVCEGYATGASIHECTGQAVAVAFNAGNLDAVAVALRSKYPALKIIIAADDDHLTAGNPGMTKARAAAQAVSGLLALPAFGADRPDKATDFNDLHQLAGVDAVRACMDSAIESVAANLGNTGARGHIDRWPEPTPLPDALPPVDPFDAELLPVALRAWVMDIAHRMQCPADFPAVAALVALSSLIGARAVIQPKARDDWQVVPNLWGAVVGRPGVKKSPALGEALKPLNRLQAAEFELWQVAHAAWEIDCKVTAMQDDGNERKAKGIAAKDPAAARALLEPMDTPAEPTARRFIVNDATVEKLGELMQQNPWGNLSYRDELYGLLTGLDKQGQEGSRAFMLQSYDGNQGYTFDRIGRGTVHIPRVCLAMIGGIQPGRIQEYVRGAVAGGSADDGLLQRFGLLVWPDVAGEFVHVDQWPDTPAKQTAWAVFERLAALQPASDTESVIWRFDDAAQALFVEWLVPFEIEIRSDDLHPAMVSHLSKYRKLIPALALVFALIDTPDSGGVIHERELMRALSFGEYLRSHANRLYAAAVMPETTDAAALLAKINGSKLVDRDGVILDSFTPRQIAVKGWAGLGTPDAVRKAADLLADFDHLRRDVVQSGDAMGRGRPSDRYLINPAALVRGAV